METFDDWYFELFKSGDGICLNQQEIAKSAWEYQQEKINHIREYLVSGMQIAPKNSEYWLALLDFLDELDGVAK